jgi:hypothetical protein
MRIPAANYQGAGNRPTVRSLLRVQKRCDPDVIFLSETRLESFPVECLQKHRLKNC